MGFYECYIIRDNRVYIRKKYMSNYEKVMDEIVPLEEFMECCFDKTNWEK